MILLFNPVYKTTIWGGNELHIRFNYPCGPSTGEAWGISAHPSGLTSVKEGSFKNMTMDELWKNHRDLFGNHPSEKFPILVKIIDASDDLSIQVHPNDEEARPFGQFGKKECWSILSCEKDSEIVIGHKAKTKKELKQMVLESRYDDLIQRFPIKTGDFFFIDSGTIHAICKNTVLLEVQQSSDLTYRFYDYNRIYEGNKRELHVAEAIKVTRVPDNIVLHELKDTPFDVQIEPLNDRLELKNRPYGTFFVLLEGNMFLNDQAIEAGTFGFVTSDELQFIVKGQGRVAWITLI